MNESTYHLQDGVKTAEEHPDTFWMPPAEERENCSIGQHVQLIFVNHADAPSERMWVEITGTVDDPFWPTKRYQGKLTSSPFFMDVDPRAPIEFGPEHVINIGSDEEALGESEPPWKVELEEDEDGEPVGIVLKLAMSLTPLGAAAFARDLAMASSSVDGGHAWRVVWQEDDEDE